MPPPPTFRASPGFLDNHAERIEFWKRVVRSEPSRAVRVLGLSMQGPNTQTAEGDTALEGMYVIAQVKDISSDSKSEHWKALVNAGVVTALCKCALSYQAAIMHPDEKKPSKKEAADVANHMYSPYFIPLEILCKAFVSCAIPPTATEKKMFDEMKKYWPGIIQRIWSEPSRSLDPEPRPMRKMERIIIPQLLGRLTLVDPSFLDVILKPADLTLPVVFRSWMHTLDTIDTRLTLCILLPLLEDDGPDNWKAYLAKHPAPPIQDLLPRFFTGASKAAGSDKKKRTAVQTANAITSAFASHLEHLEVKELEWTYDFFSSLFRHSMEHHRPFNRAVYNSSRFWAANVSVMRRAHAEKQQIYLYALIIFSRMPHEVDKDGKDAIDALVYNWLSAGMLDAFEETILSCLRAPRGTTIFCSVLAAIDRYIPHLTPKTLKLLRAQFPRPKLVATLLMANREAGSGGREQADKDYEELVSKGAGTSPQNSMWIQAGWQLVFELTHKLGEPGDCARRTCEIKRSMEVEDEMFVCEKCRLVKYCSGDCLAGDMFDHSPICGWMPFLEKIREPNPGGDAGVVTGEKGNSTTPTVTMTSEPATGSSASSGSLADLD